MTRRVPRSQVARHRRFVLRPILLVAWLPILLGSRGADIAGLPTVIEGDLLQFGEVAVKISGIDAPDAAQTCRRSSGTYQCGVESARALVGIVGGQEVTCELVEPDLEGRVVGRCWAGSTDLGAWMVSNGHAVTYTRDYHRHEQEARAAKKGIWAGEFVKPWDWRAGERLSRGGGLRKDRPSRHQPKSSKAPTPREARSESPSLAWSERLTAIKNDVGAIIFNRWFLAAYGAAVLLGIGLGLARKIVVFNDTGDLALTFALPSVPIAVFYTALRLGFDPLGFLGWLAAGLAAVLFLAVVRQTYGANSGVVAGTLALMTKLPLGALYILALLELFSQRNTEGRRNALVLLSVFTPILYALVREPRIAKQEPRVAPREAG